MHRNATRSIDTFDTRYVRGIVDIRGLGNGNGGFLVHARASARHEHGQSKEAGGDGRFHDRCSFRDA